MPLHGQSRAQQQRCRGNDAHPAGKGNILTQIMQFVIMLRGIHCDRSAGYCADRVGFFRAHRRYGVLAIGLHLRSFANSCFLLMFYIFVFIY